MNKTAKQFLKIIHFNKSVVHLRRETGKPLQYSPEETLINSKERQKIEYLVMNCPMPIADRHFWRSV